jgi:hypothetical protein
VLCSGGGLDWRGEIEVDGGGRGGGWMVDGRMR